MHALQDENAPAVTAWDVDRPWNRQPFDSDLAWYWFCLYIRMPIPRNLGKLARKVSRTQADLMRVARKNHWEDRAMAWSNYLQKEYTESAAVTVIEQGRIHADLYVRKLDLMSDVVEHELVKLLRQVKESNFSVLKPRDLLRMMTEYVRMRELLQGHATDRIEHQAAEQFFEEHSLSYEHLEALKEVQLLLTEGEKKDGQKRTRALSRYRKRKDA